MSCVGVTPAIDIDWHHERSIPEPKVDEEGTPVEAEPEPEPEPGVFFDRTLCGSRLVKKITLKNTSLLPVKWTLDVPEEVSKAAEEAEAKAAHETAVEEAKAAHEAATAEAKAAHEAARRRRRERRPPRSRARTFPRTRTSTGAGTARATVARVRRRGRVGRVGGTDGDAHVRFRGSV